LSESSLMQCRHAVPSLTTLRFTAAVIAQRFYRELAAGTLLPNLRELYMCEKPEETYDYVPMTHMLTTRRGSSTPPIQLDVFEVRAGPGASASEKRAGAEAVRYCLQCDG
jgi:hypothetical protein